MPSQGLTQLLLLLNLIVVSISLLWTFITKAEGGVSCTPQQLQEDASFAPPSRIDGEARNGVVSESNHAPHKHTLTSGGIGSTNSGGFYFVQPREGERNFYEIGRTTATDKVAAPLRLPDCLKNDS